MQSQRAIQLINDQIEEANNGKPSDFSGWRERTAAVLRAVFSDGHPVIERFEGVSYSPGIWSTSTPQQVFNDARVSGVRQGIAVLSGAIRELETTTPDEPLPETRSLHPWVSGAVAGLWDDGHHRQAVDEATRAVEIRTKAKLGVDLSGFQLFTEGFNPDPPRPDRPRLRFDGFDRDSRSWTDAHQGAMHFGQGCAMRIRNVLEHHDFDVDEQEALECLAALSLLARWVDDASLETGRV